MASHIPDGYQTVTPYLHVRDAHAAIDFYQRAFGASESLRLEGRDGKIVHAEIRIGNSAVMLADEFPEWGNTSPLTLGGTTASLMVYVDDVDRRFAEALAAGATERMAVQDQFYGDRSGILTDPFGHMWTLATPKEELSQEEIELRFQEWQEEQAAGESG